MRIKTSSTEVKHLLKAWVAISLAFTILFRGNFAGFQSILVIFGVSAITVGTAFLLHELAHKIVAQRYGLHAEFRSDDKMLLIAIGTAFLGIILAAPGAVYISGYAGINRNGKISMAGPLTNIILAAFFLVLSLIIGNNMVTNYGHLINAWIGLFNMIPFAFFDGAKILRWNKKVYVAMVAAALLLMVL